MTSSEPLMQVPSYASRDLMVRARWSTAAVVSLVTGLLLCIPLLTSLAAIVSGIIGIRKTADPMFRGRGMAVAGLVLGIVGLLGWSAAGVGAWSFVQSSTTPRQVARQFATDLTAGNIDAALAACDTSVISRSDLEKAYEALQADGALVDLSFTGMHANATSGTTVWQLDGTATCTNRTRTVHFRLIKTGPSQYVVQGFNWR